MKKIKFNDTINIAEFKELPKLKQTEILDLKMDILLGGFSSLELVSVQKNIYKFRTITDRGPNGPLIESDLKLGKNLRPFFIPDFSPMLVDFEFDLKKNKIQNLKTQNLFVKKGSRISGLPPIKQTLQNSSRIEQAIFNQKKIVCDKNGFDSEGHCTDLLGRTWVSEEYHPSIAVFDSSKKLLKRFLPDKDFPKAFAERKTNRGFEGLTCDSKYVYAMLQSPIPLKNAKGKNIVRILRIDLKTLKAKDQFVYMLEDENVDKVGDISTDNKDNFYIFEQNGIVGKKSKQFIFKTKLDNKKAISLKENPETWSTKKASKHCITKKWVCDLTGSKISHIEKIEGLAIYKNKIFLIVDNDFGLVEDKKGRISVDHSIRPKLIWFKFK